MSPTKSDEDAAVATARQSDASVDDASQRTIHPRTLANLSYIIAAIAVVGVSAASLLVGARDIPASEVWSALTDPQGTANDAVITMSRLPRTLAGLVVGVAFGIAGALIQAFTRNPLADPGILGVNAGASFAVALGVTLIGTTNPFAYIWFAFAGAIAATFAVYTIGSTGGRGTDPITITLAGVALAAVLTGLTTALTLINKDVFNKMRFWGAGSLNNRSFEAIAVGVPFVIIGVIIAMVIARRLDALALGDDMAQALGTKLQQTRIAAIIAVTLLAGAGTAIAGPIGFVGLMVPHVARSIVGSNNNRIMALTFLLAPVLLLGSDVIGRIIVQGELQVGIVTAFVGAPVLIYLARRPAVAEL